MVQYLLRTEIRGGTGLTLPTATNFCHVPFALALTLKGVMIGTPSQCTVSLCSSAPCWKLNGTVGSFVFYSISFCPVQSRFDETRKALCLSPSSLHSFREPPIF